jgi:hypothetical protein
LRASGKGLVGLLLLFGRSLGAVESAANFVR